MRRAIFQIHLCAGITLGIYLAVVGVTGSILVFRQELEPNPWRNRQALEPFADIATVAARIHSAYPGFRLLSIAWPERSSPTFVAVLRGRRRIRVSSGARDGQVLGEFPTRAGWIGAVRNLHESLLIPPRGRILNGVGAAFLSLSAITGLIVWWPRGPWWKRALTVDFRRSWRRVNYDLHSATGFWTSLLILFWGASGIYFAWPNQISQLVDSLSPLVSARPPAVRVTPDPDARRPELTTLLSRAAQLDPATAPSGVTFPYGPRAPLEIRMRRPGGSGREYEDTLYFNPYSGEYLGIWRYGVNRSLGDWIIWSQAPLHFGTAWGFGVKLVWAAAGLAVPLLAVTGSLMFWNRSLRKKWKRLPPPLL